jgi:hypothetical protein
VHDYWSASDDRLRDSAKWMAAVLGAALAALIGTSPPAGMREHHPAGPAIALGLAGLGLLGCTLALVLLYLPCGVKCLTSLRQSMIIEEITLIAPAHAAAESKTSEECEKIRKTPAARHARLKELRNAAGRVAAIGEFYRVRFRSTCATYYGLFTGLAGTAGIVAAFG